MYKRQKQFHPLHNTAKEGDVPIQVPWSVPDHDIQLGAATAVRGVVASGADHAVTMHQPHLAAVPVARHRKAAGETDLGRIHILVRQTREGQLGIERAVEFGRQCFVGALDFARQLRLLRRCV